VTSGDVTSGSSSSSLYFFSTTGNIISGQNTRKKGGKPQLPVTHAHSQGNPLRVASLPFKTPEKKGGKPQTSGCDACNQGNSLRGHVTVTSGLPVTSLLAPSLQICLRYKTLFSGSSGNTSGPKGFSMGILGGGDTVRRYFVAGPGLGATGLFIGGLCLASGLSCWAC
jgi:hypothetical protein